jgi:hypothetical protein
MIEKRGGAIAVRAGAMRLTAAVEEGKREGRERTGDNLDATHTHENKIS